MFYIKNIELPNVSYSYDKINYCNTAWINDIDITEIDNSLRQEQNVFKVLGNSLSEMAWTQITFKSLLLDWLNGSSIIVRNSNVCLVYFDQSCDKYILSVSPSSSINTFMLWFLKWNLEYRKSRPLERMPTTSTSTICKLIEWTYEVPQKLESISQHLFSMEQCPSNEHCCQGQIEVPETKRRMIWRNWICNTSINYTDKKVA